LANQTPKELPSSFPEERELQPIYVPCLYRPQSFSIAEVFAALHEEGVWIQELCIQMNRYSGRDQEIDKSYLFDFKVKESSQTPYIPRTMLEFQTPLTPKAPMTLQKFVAQMQRLDEILTDGNAHPMNPLYINNLRLVQETQEGFHMAIFGKNKKIKGHQMKASIPEAFVGKTMMPVDLLEIRIDVKPIHTRHRRTKKLYDYGMEQIRGEQLYRSPHIARHHFPSLRGKEILIIRLCEGKITQINEVTVYQCARLPF